MLRRLFTVLSAMALLLPTLTLFAGCKRDTSASDAAAGRVRARENALSYLDQVIASIRRGEMGAYDTEYRLPAYEGARAWLATVPPSTHVHPRPVLAVLALRDGWQRPKLTLLWLESGFEAHGLRLADETADVVVIDNVYPSPPNSPAEIAERSSTLLRTQTLDLAEPGDPAQGPGVVPVPRPLGSRNLKAILRYGPGTDSPPVPVYLDDMRVGAKTVPTPATRPSADP
jgi:hypothetical protein